jgi:SAM-dependent methyltransferase
MAHAQVTAPTVDGREFWNKWNATWRGSVSGRWMPDEASLRRHDVILRWVRDIALPRTPVAQILDLGCGAGWLSESLRAFGEVTGIDLADEAVANAQQRFPGVQFRAGDFCSMDVPAGRYDVLVTVDTLAAVTDQPRFAQRMSEVLKPGGHLIIGTQNRYVWERREDLTHSAAAPVRRWHTRSELKRLLRPWFEIVRTTTVAPAGRMKMLRLVNSYRLEALLTRFVSPLQLTRWREALGFGQSIMLHGRRRA